MRLLPGGCPLRTSREREETFSPPPTKKRQKPSAHFSDASSSSIIISQLPDSPMLPRSSDSKRLRTYFHFFFFLFFIFNFLIHIQSSSFWTTGAPAARSGCRRRTRAFGWDCCIVRRPTPTRSSPLGGGGESLTSRGGGIGRRGGGGGGRGAHRVAAAPTLQLEPSIRFVSGAAVVAIIRRFVSLDFRLMTLYYTATYITSSLPEMEGVFRLFFAGKKIGK